MTSKSAPEGALGNWSVPRGAGAPEGALGN